MSCPTLEIPWFANGQLIPFDSGLCETVARDSQPLKRTSLTQQTSKDQIAHMLRLYESFAGSKFEQNVGEGKNSTTITNNKACQSIDRI